jgi:chemotaxis signal transduction protein
MTLTAHPDTEQAANGAAVSAPPHTLDKYISFELAGCAYCVKASAVSEVVTPIAVTELPDSPEWLRGLAAHRGEVVAVVDPAAINAEARPEPAGAKSKLLIFRPLPEGTRFALPVDAIRELFSANASDFTPSPARSPVQPAEIIREGSTIILLDHAAVFERFYEEQPVS